MARSNVKRVVAYIIMTLGVTWGIMLLTTTFSINFLVRPYDKLFSFGLGIYGLAWMAVIVLIILRDPIWNVQINTFKLQ